MSKTAISNFYCLGCLNKIPLARKKSKMREKEHLKSLYCFKCKMEINHYEVREFDFDFSLDKLKEDIASGRFAGLDKGIVRNKEEDFKNEFINN